MFCHHILHISDGPYTVYTLLHYVQKLNSSVCTCT